MHRTIHYGESCERQRLWHEYWSKTKMYHVNMLKKYIAREPDTVMNVVPISDDDDVTVAVACVIHQHSDPELGEVSDAEG